MKEAELPLFILHPSSFILTFMLPAEARAVIRRPRRDDPPGE